LQKAYRQRATTLADGLLSIVYDQFKAGETFFKDNPKLWFCTDVSNEINLAACPLLCQGLRHVKGGASLIFLKFVA
jgi:hypothetical protein